MRLYAAEWLAFVAWCRVAKRNSLPAEADTLATYLLATESGATRGPIGRKRAAIRAMHSAKGLPLPALDNSTRAAVRQVAAPKLRRVEPAAPVARRRAELVRLAVHCSRDLAGLRDRVLLFSAACERATWEELLGLESGSRCFLEAGAKLQLPRMLPAAVLIFRGDAASCPVRALEDWLQASDTSFGPAFRKVDRWGGIEHAQLGPDGLRRIVARR